MAIEVFSALFRIGDVVDTWSLILFSVSIISIITAGMILALCLSNKIAFSNSRFSFMLTAVLNLIKVYNLGGELDGLEEGKKHIITVIYLQMSCLFLVVHIFFFNRADAGHF